MTRQEVIALLEGLGADPYEIAAKLGGLGITGKRGSNDSCPLANLLTSQGLRDVSVDNHGVEWWERTPFAAVPGKLHVITFGPPCAAFVTLFDAGYYPLLEETA